MSYYDDFKRRTNINGNTPREQIILEQRELIDFGFEDSPSYYEITIDSLPSLYGVQIVDDSQIRDEKILSTSHETPISLGSIVTWKSESWIVIHFDEMSEVYKRCKISKSLGDLNWLSDGKVKSVPFTYRTESSSNFGIQNGQIIDLGNERRQIVIPSNVDTKQIKKLNRFIIDERAWKITAIDRVKSGIINITLEETEINTVTDNLELCVADYFGNIPNYSIRILNGEEFSIRANQSLQLSAEVKNYNSVIDKDVIWSVDDESVATIDETGLLSAHANGSVTVKVSLAEDASVFDTSHITIQFATQDNYSMELDAALELVVGTSKTFTILVKNNLVIDPSRTVQIYAFADDGISSPTAASMTFNSTTQFTLKGLKSGYVKIKANLIGSSPLQSQEFRIKVKSLI